MTERNDNVLNELPGEVYTVEVDGKIPGNFKYPLTTIQAAHNQKQTNTGCLTKLLTLNIGAKVMLTVNLDILDFLFAWLPICSHIKPCDITK